MGNSAANAVASMGQRCVMNGSCESSMSYLVPLHTNMVSVFRKTDFHESACVCSAHRRSLCPYLHSGFPVILASYTTTS